MERIEGVFAGHYITGLDSPLFIYAIEEGGGRAQAAASILRHVTGHRSVTSVLTLTEVATKPYQLDRPDLADEYRTLITTLPRLMIAQVDIEIALRAARLRANHGLRIPDAVQIAACLEHGATAFVTNDRRLRRVTELQILILDDFVEP